jgi:hypothetical protein
MSFNRIYHKRTRQSGTLPPLSSLNLSEIAVSLFDGKLFLKQTLVPGNSAYDKIVTFLNKDDNPYTLNSSFSSINTTLGNNTVYQVYGTVLGGADNINYGAASTILNGSENEIYSDFALVGNGFNNTIYLSGHYSTILNGKDNIIALSGNNSAILGGFNNRVDHFNSFILGSNLRTCLPNFTYVENLSVKGQMYGDGFHLYNVGDRYYSTSNTTHTIDKGIFVFQLITRLSYTPTQDITIAYDTLNHMHGTVVGYDTNTGLLTADITSKTGHGTYSSWYVNVGGSPGFLDSLLASNNLSDVSDPAISLANLNGVSRTELSSVSSLLALNSTVSTLTSQLLPTTLYQSASSTWQDTFITVSALSATWTSSASGTSLTSPLTSDVEVGGINIAQVIPQYTTFQQFAETLLTKIYYPVLIAPSASMSSSIGTNVECGTTGFILTVNLNRGAINGMTVAGIWDANTLQNYRSGTASNYTLEGNDNGTNPSRNFPSTVIEEGTNTFNGTVTYNTGPQPVDSKGQNYSTPLISDTISSSVNVYGRRKAFYGVNNAGSSSAQIRSLSNSILNPSNGTSFTITIPSGSTNVVFAYPSSLQDVTSVLYTEGLGSDVKGNFSKTTVSVEGLNGYTGINYKVYKYTPTVAFNQTVHYVVTI